MRIGFYAGSFDPFTTGHLHVVKTASNLFDKVIIGIATHPSKIRHYSKEDMQKAIEETLKEENINGIVTSYDGLTSDEAKKLNANFYIRGIRNGMDYSYEENIAEFNQNLSDIDTIYIRAGKIGNISSSLVNELIRNNKDITNYVPFSVKELIKR